MKAAGLLPTTLKENVNVEENEGSDSGGDSEVGGVLHDNECDMNDVHKLVDEYGTVSPEKWSQSPHRNRHSPNERDSRIDSCGYEKNSDQAPVRETLSTQGGNPVDDQYVLTKKYYEAAAAQVSTYRLLHTTPTVSINICK